MRLRAALLGALLLVAGCSTVASPSASPSASGLAMPRPDRPYTADEMLAAMRTSRRPGGVPGQLQTLQIAGAVAEAVWTFDGAPWETMTIGGSCGPVRCTLEVGGVGADAFGDDLWSFEVIPAGDTVALIDADLRSMPADSAQALDALARAGDGRIDALGLLLTSARWAPPPDDHRFGVSYRSGNEEGSCELELTIDAGSGAVEQESATGC